MEKGSLLYSINDPLKRLIGLTGLPRTNIRRWITADEKTGKSETHASKSNKLDGFDVEVIRRKVLSMFEKKEMMTTRKLKYALKEDHNLDISKSTLWRCLKKIGFVFKKTDDNRKIICERGDLIKKRAAYLRKIKQARTENTNLVYLDETWINVNHTFKKEWMHKDKNYGRSIPTGKGQRLILLHAVDRSTGFLPSCKLLFKSISTDGRDYHTEMNATIFEDWLEHKLIPNLPEKSLIVMDNASYHSRRDPATVSPTMASKKQDMIEWLEERNIEFNRQAKVATKKQLYELITNHKQPVSYVTDQLIRKHGHDVLRLPPYHCIFNPIELLWGVIKNDVARNNTEFKLDAMKKITDKAISNVSLHTIQNTFEHIVKEEERYWKSDALYISPEVQPMVINIDETSSDDNYMSYTSSDSEV